MTGSEARERLLARKCAAVEHEGISLFVFEPSIAQASVIKAASGLAGEALMIAELLAADDGSIVFESAAQVVEMGLTHTVLIEKVRAALHGFASYGEPAAEPKADEPQTVAVPDSTVTHTEPPAWERE